MIPLICSVYLTTSVHSLVGIQLEYIGEIRIVSHVEASPGLAKTWPFLTMKQIIAGPAYIVQKPLIVPFEFKQIASTTQLMSPSQWTGHAAILSIDQTPPVLLSPRSYDPASADDLKPSNANANTNTNFNSSVVKSLCIESYYGDIVQCRYYLRCTILRNKAFQSNWVREMDIFIEERPRSDSTAPLVTSGLSMRYLQSDLRAAASSALRLEFGLDRLLHLQFSCIEAQYASLVPPYFLPHPNPLVDMTSRLASLSVKWIFWRSRSNCNQWSCSWSSVNLSIMQVALIRISDCSSITRFVMDRLVAVTSSLFVSS